MASFGHPFSDSQTPGGQSLCCFSRRCESARSRAAPPTGPESLDLGALANNGFVSHTLGETCAAEQFLWHSFNGLVRDRLPLQLATRACCTRSFVRESRRCRCRCHWRCHQFVRRAPPSLVPIAGKAHLKETNTRYRVVSSLFHLRSGAAILFSSTT